MAYIERWGQLRVHFATPVLPENTSFDSSRLAFSSFSPIDGKLLGEVNLTSEKEYDEIIDLSHKDFLRFRKLPLPKRGEILLQCIKAVADNKHHLGEIITLEVGKTFSEALGEVQEIIDIGYFALGLSRQLCGKIIPSEREHHQIIEAWHPLGVVGVITAFNFPMAVWGWNSFIALICGNGIVWKPSEKAPISAISLNKLFGEILAKNGYPNLCGILLDNDARLGKLLANDKRVPLLSATGSTIMGKEVGVAVAKRFGRSLLELGGNNAVVVMPDADIDAALNGVLFGALGTAGQRCTSIRRLYLEASIAKEFKLRLLANYENVQIGDPREEGVLVGPLIDENAVQQFLRGVLRATTEGGKLLFGGVHLRGLYVKPAVVEMPIVTDTSIVMEETFAPLLFIMTFTTLEEAIHEVNRSEQALSSSIYTKSIEWAAHFISSCGSECGLANVNVGTSGAEVGGAFGGEKASGGGREAGSDSWRAYVRRQTSTIYFGGGKDAPSLAQGVKFKVS